MNPKIYLTEGGKAKNLALLTSTERCEMLETLSQMEAKEWLHRYRMKVKETGKQQAQAWWQGVKEGIKKRRGQAGLDTLIAEMQRQRHDVNRL
jgi:hypothetical protein